MAKDKAEMELSVETFIQNKNFRWFRRVISGALV